MAEGWSARGQIEESLFGTDQLSVQFTRHWPVQVHGQAHSKAEQGSILYLQLTMAKLEAGEILSQ